MKDSRDPHPGHTSVNRRHFLKVAGTGVTAGSLLTMLQARQAPAQIKGTTLRILQWSHFIPAYDVWYDKFAKEWGDKNGVKVRVDHIPHLDIPARMAAEFAAGTGHDIIYNGSSILTRLYYKNLVDLTDVADNAGKKYGGWIPAARVARRGGGPLVRPSDLLHPGADALPEGPVRREQPEVSRHLGAGAGGRAHAQAQRASHRDRAVPMRRRESLLALDVLQLRWDGGGALGR